jgi:uncharacterized protein
VTSLDPRSPLVLDTIELGRRPGSMRRLQRTVQVAHDLGTEVIAVKAGTDIELDVRLESVMEGVLVSGTARSLATGECVRCLDDLEQAVEVTFQELYVYPEKKRRDGRPHQGEGDEAEADEYELQDDLVDLEPVLTDAVVLALPFQPVCSPDCPGLCAQCGARLADDPEHAHDDVDPRWSKLLDLRNDKES